jgi:hypothetical protein
MALLGIANRRDCVPVQLMPVSNFVNPVQTNDCTNLPALPATLVFTEISDLKSAAKIKGCPCHLTTLRPQCHHLEFHALCFCFDWSFTTCSVKNIETLASQLARLSS